MFPSLILLTVIALTGPSSAPVPPSNIPKIMSDLRQRIADLEYMLDAQIAENKKLREEIASLRAVVAKSKPTTQPGDNADEIAAAIKENRLVEGMTLAEARKALRDNGELVSEDSGGVKSVRWLHGGVWEAEFLNDRLTTWRRRPIPAPDSRGTFDPNLVGR